MDNLTIMIALILLPGLLATIICDQIIFHEQKWGNLKYFIYSYLLGVFCYLTLELFSLIHYFFINTDTSSYIHLKVWSIITNSSTEQNTPISEIFKAILIAPFFAFFISYLANHYSLNRIAIKFGISQKYGDENLYSKLLLDPKVQYIYFRDQETLLTYFGNVVAFSECETLKELTLSDVSVFDSYSELLYHLPKVYIAKQPGKFSIEIPQY